MSEGGWAVLAILVFLFVIFAPAIFAGAALAP